MNRNRGYILALIILGLMFSACSPPVKLHDFRGNSIAVYGKHYVLKGKVKKNHDLMLNGSEVPLRNDKSFEMDLVLTHGDNLIKLEVAPKSRDKDSFFREITIKRQAFPAEIEYAKASLHESVCSGHVDDFDINETNQQLIAVAGHKEPRIFNFMTNALIHAFPLPERDYGYPQHVIFAPDNRHAIISNYYNKMIYVVDTHDLTYVAQKEVSRMVPGYGLGSGMELCKCNGQNGGLIIEDGNVLDPNSLEIVAFYPHEYGPRAFLLSPDCRLLVTSHVFKEKAITIYDAGRALSMKGYRRPLFEPKNMYTSTAITKSEDYYVNAMLMPSEDSLIVGTDKGRIILTRINGDKSLEILKEGSVGSSVNSIALLKQLNLLLVGTKKGIYVLDQNDLKQKLFMDTTAEKILALADGVSFLYLSSSDNHPGVYKATLQGIDWKLIEEYSKLKADGII